MEAKVGPLINFLTHHFLKSIKYPTPKAKHESISFPSPYCLFQTISSASQKATAIFPISIPSLQVTLIKYLKQPNSISWKANCISFLSPLILSSKFSCFINFYSFNFLFFRCEPYSKEYDGRRIASSSSCPPSTTSVHVTALDGLVNVNSLFTIAVFVGLSLTTPNQHSLENRAGCDAGIDVARRLLVFEVVSFSFFLFSSLIAQGLKLAINLLNSKDVDDAFRAHINLKVLRFGMLGSAVGSVLGCLFLMLSMVNVIEIRLGLLSCGSRSAVHAVAALLVLVSSALVVYISTAVYAFMH